MSSARICASLVLPKLVRSPHSRSTSAWFEISANISRYGATLSSCTCRSPIAATRSGLSLVAILLFEIADGFRETPFLDVDRIIARRKDAPSANLLSRSLHASLVAQPLEKFVHQPFWDDIPLTRVNEAEVEQGDQKHFPVELHMAQQLVPIDAVV